MRAGRHVGVTSPSSRCVIVMSAGQLTPMIYAAVTPGYGPSGRDPSMASSLATALSNKVTLPDTSSAGPALASALGRVFIGWRGTDVQGHLNVMSSTDGSTFSNKVTLADTSLDGPALAGSVVL